MIKKKFLKLIGNFFIILPLFLSYSFAADNTPPTATVEYTPAGPTWTNNSVLAIITGFSEPITGLNATGYLFLTNGSFIFNYEDLAGNPGTNTATVTWIDTTPPTVSQGIILSGNTGENSSLYYNGIIDISTDVSDSGGSNIDNTSCEYTIDNGFSRNTANFSTGSCGLTGLNPTSDIQIAFRIKDTATNITTGDVGYYFYDATAPTTMATPSGQSSSTDLSITLSRIDPGIGTFSGTRYCIDTSNTCTPNILGTSVNITGDTDTIETKYLRYYSIDMLGNTESIQSDTYTIDKLFPILTGTITSYSNNINSGYAKLGDTITTYFSVNKSLITDPTMTIIGGSTTNATITNLGSNNYMATYITKSTDTDGQIQFLVSMQDNVRTTTGVINSVIYDQTAPAGINILTPTAGNYVNGSPASYTITWTTGSEVNFTNTSIKIEYTTTNFATTVLITGGMANNGSLDYIFDNTLNTIGKLRITAKDIAGNTTIITGSDFIFDNTPPSDINITPSTLYYKANSGYTLTRNGGLDANPENIIIYYSTNGITYNAISGCTKVNNEQSCTWTTPNISSNTATLRAISTDKVGQTKQRTTPTFIIDNTKPTLTFTGDSNRRNTAITGSATTTDTYAGVNSTGILYSTTSYTDSCSIGSSSAPYYNTEGIWTGYACVEDKAGNITTGSMTYKIDTTAPTIQIETGILYKNTGFNFIATGSDTLAGISGYQRSQTSGSGTITFSSTTNNETIISADTDDTYTIQFETIDLANNSSSETITLIWDTIDPLLRSGTVSTSNQTATFTFYANETGNIIYTGDCGTGVTTTTNNTGITTTSWTLANATYSGCILQVTDYAGNENQITVPTFTINYTAPEEPDGGGGGGGSLGSYTEIETCTLSDLVCSNGEYIKKSGAECEGGFLYDICNTATDTQSDSTEIDFDNMTIDGNTELEQAYSYAKNIGITTTENYEKANMDGNLIRAHLAKMISQFAIKTLNKKPDLTKTCNFEDITDQSTEMKFYIKTACQLGLMGVDVNGNAVPNFNPTQTVSRAIFGTTLSRTMRGDKLNQNGDNRYVYHLEALKKYGIMNKIDQPRNTELRGYVMLMMMRTNENIEAILSGTSPETNTEPSSTNETNNESGSTNISRTNSEQNFIASINKDFQFIIGYTINTSDLGIKYLQYFLKSKGFYQGTINGTNTEATITALFEWQKSHNIVNNASDTGAGYLGPQTREILNPLLKEFLNQ